MDEQANKLREKAKKELQRKGVIDGSLFDNNLKAIIEELSIYQIELEHQNRELIESQELLRKKNELYIDLFENAPVGYIIIDTNNFIHNINQTAADLLTIPRAELPGKKITNFIDPEYQDAYYFYFRKLIDNQQHLFCDVVLAPSSDHIRKHIRIKGYCQVHAQDNPQKYRITIEDITLEKELESKLISETKRVKENEIKFRQIVEQSFDIFFYWNLEKKSFDYISPKIYNFLGYDVFSFYNFPLSKYIEIIHPEDKYLLKEHFKDLSKNLNHYKNTLVIEFRLFSITGKTLWFEGNFSTVNNEENKPDRILGCLHNITERKHFEIETIRAKQKAEENDKLKTVFLSNMSHEIRTPMNGIIGFTDLLKCQDLSIDLQHRYINIIEKSGKRLLELINELIDISKIEAGQMHTKKTPTTITEVFSEIQTFFDPELNGKNLKFKSINNLPFHNYTINTDKDKLFAILINLVKNAIKYSHKGEITMGVYSCGSYLKFFVKDQGHGIPPEKYPIIFQRFRQVEEQGFHEGAGLGLSIVKGLTELLEGKVGFISKLNKGSVFYFTIPNDQVLPEKPVQLSDMEQIPDLSNLSIAIAEDDVYSKLLLMEMLKATGVKIFITENGLQLINLLKKEIPDIILLDINLPLKNGYECLEEIFRKKIPSKIIAVTACALNEEKEKILNLGCHGYLSKPYKQKELIGEINRLLALPKKDR